MWSRYWYSSGNKNKQPPGLDHTPQTRLPASIFSVRDRAVAVAVVRRKRKREGDPERAPPLGPAALVLPALPRTTNSRRSLGLA